MVVQGINIGVGIGSNLDRYEFTFFAKISFGIKVKG